MTQKTLILDEIHATRRQIAEKVNYDLAAIFEDARKRQEASGRARSGEGHRTASRQRQKARQADLGELRRQIVVGQAAPAVPDYDFDAWKAQRDCDVQHASDQP